jgi:two-component system sensor histidine kinase TctE
MANRSLQRELLGWLVVPLTAVVSFNVWTTYENAVETADLITDRTLLASARVIAENIRENDGVLEAPIPPAALEMFASDQPDRVVYRVTTPRGQLIAGYPDVIAPPGRPVDLNPVYFETTFRDEPVRAVAIAQPIVSTQNPGNAMVAVGQTLRAHDKLMTSLWLKALRDQVLLVAAAGLLGVFGLRRGLAPILRLRNDVTERDPAELKPFPTNNVQSELRPLVEALNEAFERVQRQIATQRRFVANAAHQLRTPLALLKTQVSVGLRGGDMGTKDEVLAAVDTSVDGMARLSNQLLSLARAEQGSSSLMKSSVDFGAVARDALEGLTQAALARHIDLGFEPEADGLIVWGHQTLLRELVVNLVDNALRYTPQGGQVTARIGRALDRIVLQVEDNGSGIPAGDREKVFERFYRGADAGAEGTGLGLAIVREIVWSHDGEIDLANRKPPPGLIAEVRLPALRAAHDQVSQAALR